jgi:ubiquinone biosynthesis protein
MQFSQTFRNIQRARQVVLILLKYGFEDLVVETPLRRLIPLERRERWLRQEHSIFEYSRYERVRMAVEELGATYIKGAQVLANRPDILPEALLKELEKLQSNVPPFAFDTAREIVEKSLGRPIPELYSWFCETPVGSASIGQVHRARLHDGTEVVVKIQRPNVEKKVTTDLDLMKTFVHQTEKYLLKQGINNPMDVVEAFEASMLKELDYTIEARNISQFRNYYKDNKNFNVPNVVKALSTKNVMTLEYIDGCKITDLEQLKKWQISPQTIVEQGLNIYLTQIFEHGFFHGDPHPGNILINKKGVINLIDFGMVGKLSPRDRRSFAGVMISMAQRDAKRMALYMQRLSLEAEVHSTRALENDLSELIDDFALDSVAEVSIADMVARLQQIIYKYKMRIPSGIFIVLRALVILDGVGKTVYPEFNTYSFIRPYGMKLVLEQFEPKNLAYTLYNLSSNLANFANAFPIDAREILHKLKKGTLKVEIAPTEYEKILGRIDSMVNRLLITLIVVALVLGSAVVMTVRPSVNVRFTFGVPIFSVVSLLGAAVLTVILIKKMNTKR